MNLFILVSSFFCSSFAACSFNIYVFVCINFIKFNFPGNMPEKNNLLSEVCIPSYPDSIFSNYLQIRSRCKSERLNLVTAGISIWCSKLIVFLVLFKDKYKKNSIFWQDRHNPANMVHCNRLFHTNWEENVRIIIFNVCA